MSIESDFSGHIPAIITATSAAVSIFSGLVVLGWWLAKQFQQIKESTSIALDAHEKLDQLREAENMRRFEGIHAEILRRADVNAERFERIAVALARMERNGNGGKS